MSKSLGRVAYEGYLAKAGGKSLISGAKLPAWDALPRDIHESWEAAAQAVRDQVKRE